MENISSFLQRFKKLLSSHGAVRQIVAEAIKQEVGIDIPTEKITIQSGVVSIQASTVVKSQVFIKKNAILGRVRALGSSISDIR